MRVKILRQLNEARADRRAAVLVVDEQSGEDQILFPLESASDQSPLMTAARAALNADKAGEIEFDGKKLFLNVFAPPLELIVIGAVHISQALAPIAAQLGYSVTVIDPREAFGTQERFPNVRLLNIWPDEALKEQPPHARTALVTLTHDPKLDDAALIPALASPAFYIGCLGSRKTQLARVHRLQRAGVSDEAIARIHGPVGLRIGAKSPAEIAVSILAEMTAVLRGGDLAKTAPHPSPLPASGERESPKAAGEG
ncbi:MAG: XdhC family protein [Alphaproteobacteria bacterium]